MIKDIPAILLAGGLGTRISTMSNGLPKPMIDVGGRPFIKYVADFLIKNGFTRIIIAASYKYYLIQEELGFSYKGCKIEWSIEESPLGTGGAISKVFVNFNLPSAFIFNADTLFYIDFVNFSKFCYSKNNNIVIALRLIENVSRYGKVIQNKDGLITSFSEKNNIGPGYINGGIYFVNRSMLDLTYDKKYSFEEYISRIVISQKKVYSINCSGYFIDIGIPTDLIKARKELPQIYNDLTLLQQ